MSSDLAQHRQAFAYCAYCPKVCRFACPVSESTRSETTSTWGKMTEAFLVSERLRPLEEGGAKALYACTGCMRCRTVCRHQNEVGFALFAARGLALRESQAPEPVRATLRTFAEHGNPFGEQLGPAVTRFRATAPVRHPLFPGCTALARRPELVEDTLVVGAALGAAFGVCRESNRCCGYPLYAAGDLDGFKAHAARVAEALRPYPELAVLDPGCAYTLKVVYPRVGVSLGNRVRTVYDVLDEHLDQAPPRERLAIDVAYHDPCHLGRGLGEYEAPRRLLRAAVRALAETPAPPEEAGCAGGGGQLPRSMPEVAVDIARRLGSQLAAGGKLVATACPTSRQMFRRAGWEAEDVVTLLRRWLKAAA